MKSNLWTCVLWPLHRAIPVRAFDGAEAAQNAIFVHLLVSNVTGTKKSPCAFVLLGEDVLYAVGIRLKGSVMNSLYLASSMVSAADASLSKAVLVQSGLENPSVFVSPTFSASFQLAFAFAAPGASLDSTLTGP